MKRSEVENVRFIVLGAARSGIAAARLLKKHGADVVVADSKSVEQAGAGKTELDSFGIESVWGDANIKAVIPDCQVMVKSPGIPPQNPIVVAAVRNGVRLISEIELASAFVPKGARIIAITGTNGKTTTTAWLTHTLNECGYNAVPAGNIGDAWCAQLLDAPTQETRRLIYVVEVSSFQLEDLEDFRPNVAVLTNISPDHMDRYDDRMELYVAAKANILKNMMANEVFIWNRSDTNSKPVAAVAQCLKRAYSASADAEGADAWVDGGQIFVKYAGSPVTVTAVDELPLPGHHNLENALCVVLAATSVGAEPDIIRKGLISFPGVEHRIELCGTRNDGVRFYNDSKATNLDAMEKAVQAFTQPIVLIAGGRDAHSDYAAISHLIKKHVTRLITLGEAAELIENAWGSLVPTRRAESMAQAVSIANEVAGANTVVVFSPACKSFDMYANFEERGKDFKQEVDRILS